MIGSSKSIILILMSVMLLGGCQESVDENVVTFVKKAKEEKVGHVEPLPTFPVTKNFKYTTMNLRDPFEIFITALAEKPSLALEEASPDLNRPREPLELY